MQRNFSIDFTTFQRKFPDLQTKFAKWNSRKINERAIYVATFDQKQWNKLPSSKKIEHSLLECHECSQRYSHQLSLFPVKSNQFKNNQTENDFPAATQTVKCTKRELTKKAREIYTQANSKFRKTYQVPLAEALLTVPELQLQQKKSKSQMKKEKRDQYRKAKKQIEQEWKETEIIRLVCRLCFYNT